MAQVWTAMRYQAEERLLSQSFDGNQLDSLHVRRTLHQSYFLTLPDTSRQDKNQVVSRWTHSKQIATKSMQRVVMVDQLWLWILDERKLTLDQV